MQKHKDIAQISKKRIARLQTLKSARIKQLNYGTGGCDMQEVFEKIIEKLKSESHWTESTFDEDGYCNDDSEEAVYLYNAIEIVKQTAAEYNNGWIPCREHQPEEAGTYNVTAYDGRKLRSTHAKWQPRLKSWNLTGTMAYWKVIAWQPLPQPYQPKGE